MNRRTCRGRFYHANLALLGTENSANSIIYIDLRDLNLPAMENISCISKWAGLGITCWRKLCSLLNFLHQTIVISVIKPAPTTIMLFTD